MHVCAAEACKHSLKYLSFLQEVHASQLLPFANFCSEQSLHSGALALTNVIVRAHTKG